jgi:DNA-binding NarL/FixJ family response regulator
MPRSATTDNPESHVQVYLVDDHPPIRDAVEGILEDTLDIDLCGHASTAQDARQQVEALSPDVVIVDISLGDEHGLHLVRSLADQQPAVEILVYSMYDESIYAERALRMGASGYLMKTEPPERLVDAIRCVERNDVYLSSEMRNRVLGDVGGDGSSGPHFAIDELTEREREVFRLVGQGHSVEDIQERLDLTRKTIETYRRRAKEKLGLESIPALVQYAVQWTYAADEEESMEE